MLSVEVISNPRINLLTIVFGIGLAFYLAIEPTPQWLLLLLAGLVGFSLDAIVRAYLTDEIEDVTGTAIYLAMPILTVLATAISLEHAVGGYWSLAVVLVVAPAFGGVVHALCLLLEPQTPLTQTARVVLNAATYLVAFSFYALAYEFDLGVAEAAFVVGLASTLLTPELLRGSEDDIYRLSIYSGLMGYVMAQTRWALDFTPLDDLLGAAFLLTTFYVITGLLQQYLSGRLTRQTAGEYGTTALVALFIILLARIVS